MKILRGELTETRYVFPERDEPEGPMTVLAEKKYQENQVTYMSDELGLHRVSNRGSDFAVSLHCKSATGPETLVLELTKDPLQCTLLPTSQRRAATSLTRGLAGEVMCPAARTSRRTAAC
jgi:prolyl-tRNA editing enzyme YbaK/EbsC (Cys-tRNA(Pro) deacylase)